MGALAGTGLFWDGGDKGLFGAFFSGGRRDSGDGIGDVLIYGAIDVLLVVRLLDNEDVALLFDLVLLGRGVAWREAESWGRVAWHHFKMYLNRCR